MDASQTVIYYLSGAGNSLRIARELSERIGDASLVPLAKVAVDGMDAPSADRVGVIFPTIMFGMPTIVHKFLKTVPVSKDAYVFAVATNGGMMAGTLLQAERILRKRGLKLSAGFPVVSHELANDPGLREETLSRIASSVKEKRESPVPTGSFVERFFMTGVANSMARMLMPRMDSGFRVNDRCNGCGLSSKICPVHNIDLVGGRPVWRHRCTQCLACLHWCPQAGLDYGKDTRKWLHKCPGMELAEYLKG